MQRYFTDQKKQDTLILHAYDTHHITKVMRYHVDDNIEVVYDGVCYEGKIISLDDEVMVKIVSVLEEATSHPEKILYLPLLKEQKMDLILQKSTELGVDEIRFFHTERSVIKLDDKKRKKKMARWQMILKEASEQAKRLSIPTLDPNIYDLSSLPVEDGLKMMCATRIPNIPLKLFLHNHPQYDRIFIAVGPEGGFTLQEEQALVQQGFEAVSLGTHILRVETVPLFCLSVILYRDE